MPIFIKIDESKSDTSPKRADSSNRGVWKTTGSLNNGPVQRSGGAGALQNVGGANTWFGNAAQVSRISLTNGMEGIDGHDPWVKFKIEQLLATARTRRTPIKVFLCPSDPAVSRSLDNRGKLIVGTDNVGSRMNTQGRLLIGTEGGIWRSGDSSRQSRAHDMKHLSLASTKVGRVSILVTDISGRLLSDHRLDGVSVSATPGTFTLTFKGETTGGL